MPVNYLDLKSQIKQLGQSALTRRSELKLKLADCRTLLEANADNLIQLQHLVEESIAKNKGLRCAVPVSESLTCHIPAPLQPAGVTIIAADGSQINPDPHGSVFYGLVNVGIFRIKPGSGKAPNEITISDLLYDDKLQTGSGSASEDLISLLRDVKERQVLARLAAAEAAPVITLTDGPLELYHEPRQEKRYESEFANYLAALDELALNNVITAGYVDRPRADLVVRLLELLSADNDPKKPETRPFTGVTDLALFKDILGPAERSAVFTLQSSSSGDYTGRKALHFFYINSSSSAKPAIARVEIPLWVAENPLSLTTLHAVLVEQARQSGMRPYPYPLIRAHEIAVVKMTDRDQLTSLIETELINSGAAPGEVSPKSSFKSTEERTRL
jgi:hypothetical protein